LLRTYESRNGHSSTDGSGDCWELPPAFRVWTAEKEVFGSYGGVCVRGAGHANPPRLRADNSNAKLLHSMARAIRTRLKAKLSRELIELHLRDGPKSKVEILNVETVRQTFGNFGFQIAHRENIFCNSGIRTVEAARRRDACRQLREEHRVSEALSRACSSTERHASRAFFARDFAGNG